MRRPLLLLLGSVVVGVLFGRVMSQIPIPHDARVFWVGNLCAPWLLLAFLAGLVQRGRLWAVLAGAVTVLGCVNGFYSEFLFPGRRSLGLPADTLLSSLVLTSVERQVAFLMTPFLVAEVLAGVAYGLLGWWWHTSRPLAAAVALGLPFVAEPALWPVDNGYYKGPWPLWALEAVAGLALIGLMALRRRGPSRTAAADRR